MKHKAKQVCLLIAAITGGSLGISHSAAAGGPFNMVTNVALSTAGELYVSDGYGNARVHKFTAEGEHLFS